MIVRSTRAVARSTARAGFTLMEVLVVVAILVVLAGTGGVIYMNYLEDAKADVARTQVKSLEMAADAYRLGNGDYPPNLAVLTQPEPNGKAAKLEPNALIDPWGREYSYAYPGQHHQGTTKPDIWSAGKDGNTMIGNWSPGIR
jgi:general secretion pathway protein G